MLDPQLLVQKIQTGVAYNGCNITPSESAMLLDMLGQIQKAHQKAEQFTQMATMAIAKLGGYMTASNKEITELKGGLYFGEPTDDNMSIYFLPSEEDLTDYIGLEDVLVRADLKDEGNLKKWVVIAKEPEGNVIAHCDDDFLVLSPEEIHDDFVVTPRPERISIEAMVKKTKEEERNAPKILRP